MYATLPMLTLPEMIFKQETEYHRLKIARRSVEVIRAVAILFMEKPIFHKHVS